MVEYVNIPLALTSKFQLYRVAASKFKTVGADQMRFEWS